MKFLKRWFESSPKPAETWADPVLGELRWSRDAEAWVGLYRDRAFSVARSAGSGPSEMLLVYARTTLEDDAWLRAAIEQAKREFLSGLPPGLSNEVASLQLGDFSFFEHGGTPCLFAELVGGQDERAWRAEFTGRTCCGIGFDR